MEQPKEYFAFISYKREDEEWAKWLAHELEHYHLPVTLNGRDDLPRELRPIFRDADELSAGNLPDQIHTALMNSKHLVVICSPRAAKSEWVNKEIEEFINFGKTGKIYPFIVDGVAMSNNIDEECFPPALKNIPKEEERLGGNVNEKGRDAAVIKIVAGMLNLGFDTLWNRYEREKAEEEQRKREERDNLLRLQSRYIAEKVEKLLENGDSYLARLFALEALPKELENPNRPYVPEAEAALRKCVCKKDAILKGHTDSVNSVAFSPDGKYVASASWDSHVIIWEVKSGALLHLLSTNYDPKYSWLSFSNDGSRVYARPASLNIVDCWDVETGEKLEVYSVCDGDYLCHYPNGELLNIDSNDKVYHESLKNIKDISVTYDGRLLAALFDESVLVWDTEKNVLLYSLGRRPSCYAFSYDGQLIATSDFYEIALWDTTSGISVNCRTNIGEDNFYFMSFSANGKYILATSPEGVVKMFSVPELQLIKTFKGHTGWCHCAIYSPNEELIASASGDCNIRLWGPQSYEPVHTIKTDCMDTPLLLYCPDGEHILYGGSNCEICMCNIKSDLITHSYKGLDSSALSVVFSPEGNKLMACNSNRVIIWDVETEQVIHIYETKCHMACFSPNGSQILIVGYRDFRIIDIASWQVVRTKVRNNKIKSAFFLPDNQSLVIATEHKLEIWREYNDVHRDINDSSYWLSADNQRVAWVIDDDIREWLRCNKVFLHQELNGHTDWINSVTCSSDGKKIASASNDATIRIWDVQEMKELKVLKGHTDEVLTVDFSNDGKLLLSASKDRTVIVWDVESGIELYHLLIEKEQYDELFKASFSPDNKWIATLSNSIGQHTSVIKIWPYSPLQELIDQTRERFKDRQLTPEERKKYYLN
ncbi:TIR domain-containing protein [Prevotella sp. E2-28]|uniref:toll/interleukin-1 receptor domain-containing protein n=1 Tax=Prevotella sp. E2-28 TaxID=2913620 RepID=UPI001EDBE7D2|nr:TIR domain-containing protein [Prevotella sp. E2-28]UKK54621.1 TIR domain-containing protein [Prevotella sp. E2-28]